jgi:hypothetical protein
MRKIKNIFINLLGAALLAACTARAVSAQLSVSDLATDPGANLTYPTLSWTYPEAIASGNYIIRYSTNPADFAAGPDIDDVNKVVVPISAITASDPDSYSVTAISVAEMDGIRVLPYYFAVWLYNGTSTSTISNLAQNMYFPAATVVDGNAVLNGRLGMSGGFDNGAKFAKVAAGVYSALSFNSGGDDFIALNAPSGQTHYYYSDSGSLELKALAADPGGNAYALIQKSTAVIAAKFASDGTVLWSREINPGDEIAGALVYGGGSVYAATEYLNGSGNSDIRIRKLSDSTGAELLAGAYDSSVFFGYGSDDQVSGLAFATDGASNNFLYAAGASGFPASGRLIKFADTGTLITTSTVYVPGSWPMRYSNPSGGDSRVITVKSDMNGNLVVAGSEQRYDLNQGQNIWVNRYNSFGTALFSSPARYNNPQANADDVPTGLDFDQFGNIYVSAYTDMWPLNQGYNMLAAKFGASGQFLSARIFDSGSGNYDLGTDVHVSTDNFMRVAGLFGGGMDFGVYSMPLGASANTQFFNAAEGPYTGSADLMWNYTGRLPAGSTYYIQYSLDSAPVWNKASSQITVHPSAKLPGEVQQHLVGGLATLRYPGQEGTDNRGNLYQFKVWITSAGLTTELPVVQTFARTPNAFDNTQYFGAERLSYMSGLSTPPNAIKVDGTYVYHAFAGRADGANAGFGLRKYNTGQYLEWTKFFNHSLDRAYQVGSMTRDAAGNFYLVGSQYPVDNNTTGPENMVAGKDLWIAKLNSAGNLVWSYSADVAGLDLMDELYDAAIEGNYLYVVGTSSTAANGMSVLARKYDITPATAPVQVWTYSMDGAGSADDFGYGVAVGTGSVYLSGTVHNSDGDIFLRALDKSNGAAVGGLIEHNSGFGDDEGYALALTTTTPPYLYLGGSVATLGGTAGDAALFKYALAGTAVWQQTFDGKDGMDDAVYAVKANDAGVVVAGYTATSSEGDNSYYRKYDSAGNPVWTRVFDFASTGDDEVYGLDLDASGRVYSAVSLWDNNPGFYYFPEPNFYVSAEPGYVPGSVRLDWMSGIDLPAGSTFHVQYSTFSGAVWSSDSAQVHLLTGSDIYEGMSVSRSVYGLNSGRDAAGASTGPLYYFKIWAEPYSGGQLMAVSPRLPAPPSMGAGAPELVSDVPAAARAAEGWGFENMSFYPNEAKLFVMGDNQQYYTAGGEKEFPGLARGPAGSFYSVANMDWNGNGGFALKKFSTNFLPLWTMYYAPGESYSVKANRVAVDDSGIYITGYERSPSGDTGKDIFVMKFGEGGLAWKSTFNLADYDDVGYGIALDGSSNVYIAGSVNNSDGDDAFLAKYSPAGVLLSTVTYYGLDSAFAYAVAVQGIKVYAAGSSEDPGKGSQLWIGGFGPNLTQVTTTTFGGDNSAVWEEAAFDVAIDTSGFVYIAGQVYNPANQSMDAVVSKYSANLASLVSSVTYNSQAGGADAVQALAIGPFGSVYAAGYTERYDINQDRNLWLRRYAQNLGELGTQEFHSNAIPGVVAYGPNSDEATSLALDIGSGFVMAGGKFGGLCGVYRYKQVSTLAVNPVLTVKVGSVTASASFPGVGVTLIPFTATGIDVSGSLSDVTNSSGTVTFQVPAGKQYFVALDKQGYNPSIKDQQMDPYGNFLVTMNSDLTKNYVLSPRPASTPYYPLTVFVTSATAGDYLVSEVFFTQTGEKAAYGISRVPANVTATTVTITNVPPASAGAYTLGITIPNRSLARSVLMSALFPATSSYSVSMSTLAGAIATTGGFQAGASTTPASVEGVIRSERTWSPVEQARVRLWNYQPGCMTGNCDYNVYETLSDVNGKYSFYNVRSTAAPYNLMAQKSGYKRAGDGNVFISPSSPTYYRDFQLQESTYSLRGYVRYRDIPIPNADVMIWGDYSWYGASDSYKNGTGMDTDARTKTGADGLFVFSPATLNALPDGQVRLSVSFMGNRMELNEGNTQDWNTVDGDDVRVVISSQGAKWTNLSYAGSCTPGRVWKLSAKTGACQGYGDMNFNIMPPSQNDYATLSGSVTFVTTFTVTEQNPLVISTMSPVTVMAMQECSDCRNRSMGFAVLTGTYTVNRATYSITLSTGMVYYTRVTSSEWGEISSFDDRADFRSTVTASVRMNFVVTRSGRLKGVVKMADGSNYKPAYDVPEAQSHRLDINVRGQNVSVDEGWGVDEYGEFDFPNLAPGLYTLTLRPQGEGFRWATPVKTDVAVAPGKTTQVTMNLETGLYVQPQIIGLPEISTPSWAYVIIPVPSGTEMNQKKITDMFFGKDIFAFNYSTSSQTWDKKIMQAGQYDFYLMLGARYNPGDDNEDPESYDQFGNFIGKLKSYSVQRNDASPNLGTETQPIQVNVLGSLGQATFEGTIAGARLYTDRDLDRIISNFNELFPVIPAVMIYDAAGDLRGYTAALPTEGDFPEFWSALESKEKAPLQAYFTAKLGRFMVSGLPPGRYTVVFNNPNYPPIAKEMDIPLAASYNGVYPFDFDAQQARVGSVYGTVRSSANISEGLDNAVVYLRHRTVEKFATTAADGSFAFDYLPPGIYKVEVTRDGYVKSGQRTSLAGGDSSELTFYMVPSQSNMTGKVYMSKFPAPVTKSGVKVVAYDETYNVLNPTDYLPKIEATTNDAGEYELTGVVPGHTYKVTAFDTGKQPATLDVSSETVTEGTSYLPDIVMREVPPQIIVKVRRSANSVSKVDVSIKSPKELVTKPVCKVNPGEEYVAATADSLMLVPAPNNTYLGEYTVSSGQDFYNFHVEAGDGSNKMSKDVTYSPNNQAKTEQYIQNEAIQGGEVQMDKESEEYSGIELDTGGLAYSTFSETASQDFSNLVGGFFSALPSVRTVKTAKGSLSITQAIQDLMASEIYNMNLDNAQANKEFTLTLKYDKDKASDNANLRIYQYDEASGAWNEVPGNYTTDPMLGVLSVGIASLTNASEGTAAASTPLGRKRFGMSAVVNGRYVPSAAPTQQSGRFAVFTAMPGTGVSYTGTAYQVYNLPNPFNLKPKSVALSGDVGASGISNPYQTSGTLIKYHLPPGKSGTVKFVIYNLAGEKVRTINDGVRAGGEIFYSEWDGKNDNNKDCASGVYFMLSYLDGNTLGTKAHKLALIK